MSVLPKILIVDDEPIIRDTLDSLLAAEDLELLFAENGEQGLKMAQEFLPDAILLDVMMPGMDGYETCRQIRARSALAEIPVIMVTALDDRSARLTGLAAGADDFLTKPFDGLEIQIRIKNIVRINRYRNLIAERSRFLWVVDHAEQGYLILDDAGCIQYANQRARLFCHLPEDYTGLDFTGQIQRYYQAHAPTGMPTDHLSENVSYLVQPESATARAFWLRVEVLDAAFEIKNQRLVRVSDVTDELATQQDIRKVQHLVAHKLRTPVSHIYGGMSLLALDLDDLQLDEIKLLVKNAWTGVERLVSEVHDIVTYMDAPLSLAEGHPLILSELSGLIEAARERLELTAVELIVPAHLPDRPLNLSTGAMELIVYEILENAKKFHPHHAPHIQVQVEAVPPNNLQLHFMDDGQVMTARQIAQAERPYTQGEKWFTGEASGMGLGLPLVATLVWQAGGQLHLANRADQLGVCVSLTVPHK